MPVTTTAVFDHLERHPTPSITTITVRSDVFRVYRRAIFSMSQTFRQFADQQDDAEAQSQADKLREHLSRLLTAPTPWDEPIPVMNPERLQQQWGRDVSDAYEHAKVALTILQKSENPLRTEIDELLDLLNSTETSFRIYCHSENRHFFETLLPCGELTTFPADCFLHSVRDYAESDAFDMLIKIGPLRAKGWGAAPDALLTSSRFDELCQISWEGTHDEDDFGFDPVKGAFMSTAADASAGTVLNSIKRSSRYTKRVSIADAPTNWTAPDLPQDETDELKHFHEIAFAQRDKLRPAVLLYTDNNKGLFFLQGSEELSYDPSVGDATVAVKIRRVKDELKAGMFVIVQDGVTADLGTTTASGVLSRQWKEELRRSVVNNGIELEKRLREAGLNHADLRGRITVWRQTRTVINAPQTQVHFKALIDVLMGRDKPAPTSGLLWWQEAWNEVRRSRGEAITFGTEKSLLVQEELCEILRNQIPDNAEEIDVSFPYVLPDGHGPQGTIRFLRIARIEKDYRVPEAKLTKLLPVNGVEQWRV